MSAEVKKEIELEIAYVLFIDIVGYSTLLIDQQRRLLELLNKLVRGTEQEKVRAQPDYAPALCVLGLIDAALGRKEDALREGKRAIELLPIAKDSINGAHMIEFFTITAAWAGDKDLAIQQLEIGLANPTDLTYGQLQLHPYWDPLRGDPRFEKIVADLAPKN